MKTGQGFVLVFSIASTSSMDEMLSLRDEIVRIKDDENVPIVIVGNKADLEENRAVPRAKGFAISQRWSAPYYEASARTRSKWNTHGYGALSPTELTNILQPMLTKSSLISVVRCSERKMSKALQTSMKIHTSMTVWEPRTSAADEDASGTPANVAPFYERNYTFFSFYGRLEGGWTCPRPCDTTWMF